MSEHVASSAELSIVCQRLAAYYTALAKKETAHGVAGYASLDKERTQCLRLLESCLNIGLLQKVKLLVRAISTYLDRQGYWTEDMAALIMRLNAARQAGDRKDEGWCLNSIGYNCRKRGESAKALACYEQSLSIRCELGDRQGKAWTLNNIAEIYCAQDRHKQALQYFNQSLTIMREIGDRKGEGMTMNNIGMVYDAQGDYETALTYLEQNLSVNIEVDNKILEGATLNNIARIYDKQGNTANALEYWKQALVIHLIKTLEYFQQALAGCQEIGERAGEEITRWNIGLTYEDLGELVKAEEYISQSMQIAEEIGHPGLEECREDLARVRAKQHGIHDK